MKDIIKKIALSKVVFTDIKDENGVVIDTISDTESRNYLLVLNINAIEEIGTRYKTDDKDGFEVWGEKASNSGNGQYKALAEFLCICVNEGIKIENKHRKQVKLPLLEKFNEDEINIDLSRMLNTVTNLVTESTQTGSEKN